ncbi:hypothetical protein, partial [Streptantibioticus ferralitis]
MIAELWSSVALCRPETRHAEVDRRDASQPLALFAFLTEEGEGEVDALDLTEPSLLLGTGPASQEIGLDLVEARQHVGVDVEHGTSQTSFSELIDDGRELGVRAHSNRELVAAPGRWVGMVMTASLLFMAV